MEYGSRYPFWPKARPWEFPWKRNLRHVRVSGGGDRVSGLGSMLYGPTLRGHVPSDLAFRSHLGSSLELSCLPELGAVFFSMSSDSGQEKLLKMYNISCRYNGPFRHWKVVPGYVYDIVYAHTNSAASQEQLAERPNNNPIVDGRTELEHYLDNHEMKGFYERWDETGLALRILLAPSLQEPPTTISVMHGNWLGITEPVDEDPTSSHKEEDDTEVAAYWKARRDKEEADIMANFNERAMTIVVAALGLRPGSTSAFATSAVSVVQPAPFSILQEDTSAVSVVQPAPFRKVASPVAHAVAHAHADAPVAHSDADADADTEADADQCCWICGNADHLSYVCPDNCCWICGDRDHWSNRCPFNMTPYEKVLEALTDLWWFEDLRGEDLMSMYHDDIAAERLRLLRRKAEELASFRERHRW